MLYMNPLQAVTFGTTAQRFFKHQASLAHCLILLRESHSNSGQIDSNFGHVILNELLSAYVCLCGIELMHRG